MTKAKQESISLANLCYVPEKHRADYEDALLGKSITSAIRIKCLMCKAWSEIRVLDCKSYQCPLHGFRLDDDLKDVEN